MLKKKCCDKEYKLNETFCGVCGKQLEVKNYCTGCGAEIPEGIKFCGNCGAEVNTEAAREIVQPAAKSYIDVKPAGIKNRIIGIAAVAIIAVVLLLLILPPIFNKPIVGKWNMELYGNTFTEAAYMEFKGNGTYMINTLGVEQAGKYKILKNGAKGRIRLIPDNVNDSSIETEYVIEDDIVTFGNGFSRCQRRK